MSTINLKRIGLPQTSTASIPGCRGPVLEAGEKYKLSLHTESGLVRIENLKGERKHVHLVHVSRLEFADPDEAPAAPVTSTKK